MDKHQFKNTVYNWVYSCTQTEAVENIRRFVNDHAQIPDDVKQELNRDINTRIAVIKQLHMPPFVQKDDTYYLADKNGHPKVFTTRFSAISKVAELKMKGYDADLKPGDVFYRIKLNTSEAVTA